VTNCSNGGERDPVGSCGTPTVLKRTADTTFDDRSRAQVMADTLVERITGRPAGQPEPVAVNLVLSDETLLSAGNSVAVIEGLRPDSGRGGTRACPRGGSVPVAMLSARAGGWCR
jgi:hypothetical protein